MNSLPEREPDGQFSSFTEWVCKATSWIGGMNALCADAEGRVCKMGADFQRADKEKAFPVRFWFNAGDQTKEAQKKAHKAYTKAMKLHYPWRFQGNKPQYGVRSLGECIDANDGKTIS